MAKEMNVGWAEWLESQLPTEKGASVTAGATHG